MALRSTIPGKSAIGRITRLLWIGMCVSCVFASPHASSRPRKSQPKSKGCDCANTELIAALERVSQPPGPPRAHDPTVAKDHGKYYLFTTGPGIPFSVSTDLKTWKPSGRSLPANFDWIKTAVPGAGDNLWAPHVVWYKNRWLLFYAASTFGKNLSAIGVATNKTLDPESKEYRWEDGGLVISTHPGDTWNAIDPHFIQDEHGSCWLAAGSFWGGLKLVSLDPQTLHANSTHPIISIAARPHTPEIQGAIEAPSMLRHGDYWYLFASFDFCCRGVQSTYNVRVGRSKAITGPYADKDGKPMLEGGGTQVLFPTERWKGPGHNGLLNDRGRQLMVYHAYDAADQGVPKLRIATVKWDADGWPVTADLGDSSNE